MSPNVKIDGFYNPEAGTEFVRNVESERCHVSKSNKEQTKDREILLQIKLDSIY